VALHDGQLAGFVSAIDGFLSGIFIAPGHQGQGLGRYLVEFALKPDQPARVEVMARNRSGLGFYQRLGFRPTSFRVHDTLGHCLVEMTRPASAADHIPA
ncbi:MAG: GNAT family N-acetyltransferase, partial [Mangrovicoccus sp.]